MRTDMLWAPDMNKVALDQLVGFYMHERKLTGRRVRIAVYESAEEMLPIWRDLITSPLNGEMSYESVMRLEKSRPEWVESIMVFIDRGMPAAAKQELTEMNYPEES